MVLLLIIILYWSGSRSLATYNATHIGRSIHFGSCRACHCRFLALDEHCILGTSWSIWRDGLTILQRRINYFAQGRVGQGTRCRTPARSVHVKVAGDETLPLPIYSNYKNYNTVIKEELGWRSWNTFHNSLHFQMYYEHPGLSLKDFECPRHLFRINSMQYPFTYFAANPNFPN